MENPRTRSLFTAIVQPARNVLRQRFYASASKKRCGGREFGDQLHTFSCLSVLHNAVVACNMVHIQLGGRAATQLQAEGQRCDDELLSLTTPLLRRHLNPFGRYLQLRFGADAPGWRSTGGTPGQSHQPHNRVGASRRFPLIFRVPEYSELSIHSIRQSTLVIWERINCVNSLAHWADHNRVREHLGAPG